MENRIRRRYAHVFRSLGRAELQANNPSGELSLDDLFGSAQEELWLGFYSHDGLMTALERYGFLDEIRRLGYEDLYLELGLEDEEQMFRIKSELPRAKEPLVELVAKRSFLALRDDLSAHFSSKSLPILSIEWLLLQNPLRDFSVAKPPLPGQRLPGLGLGRQVFELLRNISKRLKLDALITVPSFFHNAVFYGEEFCFVDPKYEGKFQALKRDLLQGLSSERGLSLAQLSWALRWEYIFEETTQGASPFAWFHEPMISPRSDEAKRFIESRWYTQERDEERARVHYLVSQEELMQRLAVEGFWPFDLDKLRAGVLAGDKVDLV